MKKQYSEVSSQKIVFKIYLIFKNSNSDHNLNLLPGFIFRPLSIKPLECFVNNMLEW